MNEATTSSDCDNGNDHSWQPQSEPSDCEFTYTVTSYASKRESGDAAAEYSPIVTDSLNNQWRLIVYVNGRANHYVSIFLQVANADQLPFGWKKHVSYVLSIDNSNYSKRNPDKVFTMCPKAVDWGWSQFISATQLLQYIQNDSFTIRAQVQVKHSHIQLDHELYLKAAIEDNLPQHIPNCIQFLNCHFPDDQYTPLHTACSCNPSLVPLLLQHGANVNATNKWDETPLLIASNNGHTEAVQQLLQAGADPMLVSQAGWSALTFAAHKGFPAICKLMPHGPIHGKVLEDDATPLHKACAGNKRGHYKVVLWLLQQGADKNALNQWKETPLLTAANHGRLPQLCALLQAGADPTLCTDTGWSPLSIAAYKGHAECVKALIEEGQAPTEEQDSTLSALLQAATKGFLDICEILLEHGADPNVTTKKGDTALSLLVEQHLLTPKLAQFYHKHVTRCSKDRRKVQRAKLLVQWHCNNHQQHAPSSSQQQSSPSLEDEEEKAQAAEQALLLELEQEEQVKQSKQKKKRKKEKQLKEKRLEEEKMKEELKEKQRIEREQREEEERVEQRKKEMERERRVEQERLEKAKEQERREKAEQERREKEKLTSSVVQNRRNKPGKKVNVSKISPDAVVDRARPSPTRNTPLSGNRRWETKAQRTQASEQAPVLPALQAPVKLLSPRRNDEASHVENGSLAAPSSSSDVSVLSEVPLAQVNGTRDMLPHSNGIHYIEHPAISLFRREKVFQMLDRCRSMLDETSTRSILYRWLVRAAHDTEACIDPIIPSWKSREKLVSFFQRQLIAESHLNSNSNMESAKEAGTALALYCEALALEVDNLRQRVKEQLPPTWTDAALGMAFVENIQNGESVVILTWANRSSVELKASTFTNLRSRYVGQPTRFLAAAFVTTLWYETRSSMVADMDICLPRTTQACLVTEMAANAELGSDPLMVFSGNIFWGTFEQVDRLFGAQCPFAREKEHILAQQGGSIAAVLPRDSVVATRYVRHALDILDSTTLLNVPLSFALFLHADCFCDPLSGSPSNDLNRLDPRLSEIERRYLRFAEILKPGQHFYQVRGVDSGLHVIHAASIFVLLQNEAGADRFPVASGNITNMLATLSVGPAFPSHSPILPIRGGLANDFPGRDSPLTSHQALLNGVPHLSPTPLSSVIQQADFGAIGGTEIATSFSPANETVARASRRGRLFDLVDNEDEDHTADVDLVSGMLNNLGSGLFHNMGSDVDIEAISLMGIGRTSRSMNSNTAHGSFR